MEWLVQLCLLCDANANANAAICDAVSVPMWIY